VSYLLADKGAINTPVKEGKKLSSAGNGLAKLKIRGI